MDIVHPITKEALSIFSNEGKHLLKHYVNLYQSGGASKSKSEWSTDYCPKCMNTVLDENNAETVLNDCETCKRYIETQFSTLKETNNYKKKMNLLNTKIENARLYLLPGTEH